MYAYGTHTYVHLMVNTDELVENLLTEWHDHRRNQEQRTKIAEQDVSSTIDTQYIRTYTYMYVYVQRLV